MSYEFVLCGYFNYLNTISARPNAILTYGAELTVIANINIPVTAMVVVLLASGLVHTVAAEPDTPASTADRLARPEVRAMFEYKTSIPEAPVKSDIWTKLFECNPAPVRETTTPQGVVTVPTRQPVVVPTPGTGRRYPLYNVYPQVNLPPNGSIYNPADPTELGNYRSRDWLSEPSTSGRNAWDDPIYPW